jgi:hypothetical protein
MKNTRTNDLGMLEDARDNMPSLEGRMHLQAILENVYEQSKDPFLEKMRIQLTDAMKQNDHVKLNEIRTKIQGYAKSPTHIKNIAKKIHKATNRTESGIYITESLK